MKLSLYLAVLGALSSSSTALARDYTLGEPRDCCGQEVYVDCPVRPGATDACAHGSRYDHTNDEDYFGKGLKCFNTGCVIPSTTFCAQDIADGTTVACTKNVRSCAAQSGSAICDVAGPAGANACEVIAEGYINFCPKFACRGGMINNTDTDRDGLYDCWETEGGIDDDGDGTIDFDLSTYGVNPKRVDVLVEIDFFDCHVAGGDCAPGVPAMPDAGVAGTPADLHSHQPDPMALQLVQAAFASALNANPDGTTGVHLAFSPGMEALAHRNNCDLDATCFDGIKAANFGTPAERASGAIAGKRVAVHYALWNHDQGPSRSSSGLSNQPGGNLMISLGTTWARTIPEQAGTFMHELGHNLGLDHGGVDNVNHKPNYFSVMNYEWQFGIAPARNFDYSRSALPTLDETALSEALGVQGNPALVTDWVCPNANGNAGSASGPLDWNCNGTAADLGVVQDLNHDRICLTQGPNNNLDSVPGGDDALAFGTVDPGPDGVLNSTPLATSDDLIVGSQIVAGSDAVLQSVPLAGSDDVVAGIEIWDGPNRTCESTLVGDDQKNFDEPRAAGDVERTLKGYDDWSNLDYDFVPHLDGYTSKGVGSKLTTNELTFVVSQKIAQRQQLADLGVSQRGQRNADGSITYVLQVTNRGPKDAIEPTMNERIPGSLAVLSCISQRGNCVIRNGYLSLRFVTLASGETLQVVVNAQTVGAVPNGTHVTATIAALSTDTVRSNNQSSICLLPPAFTAPANLSISSCAGLALGTPTFSSACGLTVSVSNDAPAVFPLGTTTVTWTAVDSDGNRTSATQLVTATLGDDPSCCPIGSNKILGSSGTDTLFGTSGVDCILARGGLDIVDGRGGNDFISGGDGPDQLIARTGSVYISGGAGNDLIQGGDQASILIGGPDNDIVSGGNGADTIDLGPGNDQAFGLNGDDVIHGGTGIDVISGGAGNDRLFGDEDNDTLIGDLGDDTLDGGPGTDVCNRLLGHDTVMACEL